ncbi:hypothetical protein ACSBR2_003222 [Camellia fascicularis]
MAAQGGGGWKPVFRRRFGRPGASSNIHTVFVDDIPVSMSPKGLFAMFTNFGVVKDVFIPNKRRKATQSRFGFVRFDCPVAAEVAIQKAHGVWCEDKMLKVKKANFGMEQGGKGQLQRRQETAKQEREATGRFGTTGFVKRGSYADVLKGTTEKCESETRIQAEEYGNGWLYESVIVKMRKNCSCVDFKNELQNSGWADLKVEKVVGE